MYPMPSLAQPSSITCIACGKSLGPEEGFQFEAMGFGISQQWEISDIHGYRALIGSLLALAARLASFSLCILYINLSV